MRWHGVAWDGMGWRGISFGTGGHRVLWADGKSIRMTISSKTRVQPSMSRDSEYGSLVKENLKMSTYVNVSISSLKSLFRNALPLL